MRAANFIRALGRAKIDSPQLNKVALNMLINEFMNPQKANPRRQRDMSFREAIASSLLNQENPDYKKAYSVYMGGDLGSVFGGGKNPQEADIWAQRQKQRINELSGGSTRDVERAALLKELSSNQYKQYEKESPTFGDTLGKYKGELKQEMTKSFAHPSGWGLAAILGGPLTYGAYAEASAAKRVKNKKREQLLNRLLGK